jgi:glutaredoxin
MLGSVRKTESKDKMFERKACDHCKKRKRWWKGAKSERKYAAIKAEAIPQAEAQLPQVVHGEVGRWFLGNGFEGAEIEELVRSFIMPGIEVKDLRALFALDAEDVDQILEGSLGEEGGHHEGNSSRQFIEIARVTKCV